MALSQVIQQVQDTLALISLKPYIVSLLLLLSLDIQFFLPACQTFFYLFIYFDRNNICLDLSKHLFTNSSCISTCPFRITSLLVILHFFIVSYLFLSNLHMFFILPSFFNGTIARHTILSWQLLTNFLYSTFLLLVVSELCTLSIFNIFNICN